MGKMMISRKFFYAGTLLVIFFGYSLASGENLKKTVSIPPEVNGRELMQAAVSEGRKLRYGPKREEGKVVLIKKMPARFTIGNEKIYQITLSIAPGDGGRKVFTLEGEFTGDLRDRELLICFDCEFDQIEQAVKKALETK
jgi:hypothetical protein